MNNWMTEERRQIARQYVHDMINSFVEDPQGADYHDEYDPPYVSFYSPDIERLLEKACYNDKYSVRHPEFACCTMLTIAYTISKDIVCGRLAARFTSISMVSPLIKLNASGWRLQPGGGRISTSSGCIANPGSTSIKYDCQSKFGSLFSLWLSQWEELRSA